MTQEEKELLLQDLCARLPYGVLCDISLKYPLPLQRIFVDRLDGILLDFYKDGDDYQVYLTEVKPYLRPMSSMTEEEQKEFIKFHCVTLCPIVMDTCLTIENESNMFYWLNAHYFDYRGLIEKGLALEAPEGMYDFK